ncbi:MAG: polysaccharide biosynthesis/export family protein [Bacteroidales bacterium]|nr:polysaccharide biosynthesis/export family protein [Bacteroidales bacterium]
MKRNLVSLMVLLIVMVCTSCMTPRKVLYLQDMSDSSAVELETNYEARIAPSDRLGIFVSSDDDKELVELFNQHRSQQGLNSGTSRGWYGYLVDVNGNIYFPVLGKLHVEGLTRIELQDTITQLLKEGGYLKTPYVTVELSNFKINFLGADGGKVIYVDGDRCTLFEALALSGDLGTYTRRDKVKVYRQVDGKMTCRTLDLRSSKVFNDPYFQLQQNDYVVTQSIRGLYYKQEVSYWLSWVSALSSVLSVVTTVMLLTQVGAGGAL